MFKQNPLQVASKAATAYRNQLSWRSMASFSGLTPRLAKALRNKEVVAVLPSVSTPPPPGAPSNSGAGFLRSLLYIVIIPTIAVFLYYVMLASDVYVTEVKLTVRKTQEGSYSDLSSSVTSSFMKKLDLGSSYSSGQDVQIIADYLKSRAIIHDLGGKPVAGEYFSRGDIDWLSRLKSNAEMEEIWEYWREHITVSIDSVSSILTMRVRAYSSDDSYRLANRIVENSERLINNIAVRTKNDALTRASEEVKRSAADLAGARTDILNFQKNSGSIDPVMAAKQITSAMTELSLKRIQLQSQIDVGSLSGLSERPGEKYLETKVKVIDDQIRQFADKLTGVSTDTLSEQLKEYQLLKLQEDFSEKIYMLARSDYEEARRRILAQQLYVVVVVPPMLPESALLPRPVLDTFVVFLGLFVVWGIGCLLFASIKDSRV